MADEIPDPRARAIASNVWGQVLPAGSTAEMICGGAELIDRRSCSFTLEPNGVTTGTMPAVGWLREPRRLL